MQDTEEDTFIRPETMLRRALMAIDPQYAERTDIDTEDADEDESGDDYRPSRPYFESEAERFADEEEDTAKRGIPSTEPEAEDEKTRERVGDLVAEAERRKLGSEPTVAASSSALMQGLSAFRVAVLPIPEERDVRLIFIPPGQDPPPGVATALLVPPSPEDARLINEIYNDTDAKF